MSSFIKRNLPVFIVGFLTLGVFVAIIFLSQKTESTKPVLEKIEEEKLVPKHTYTTAEFPRRVVLIEFSDYGCPACKVYHPEVDDLSHKYYDDLLVAFRHFPLPQHTGAYEAAMAAQAAGRQGKFWEYSDILFKNQPNFEKDNLIKYAEELKLNKDDFIRDMEHPTIKEEVDIDMNFARKLGVNYTPAFVLNRELIRVNSPAELEQKIIEAIKAEKAKQGISESLESSESTESENFNQPSEEQLGVQETNTPISQGDAINISYTPSGFSPNNLKVNKDQLIRFTNNTTEPINIKQLIVTYPEFSQPVEVKPGESFEFVLSVPKLWTYKELSRRHYGSIYVIDPNSDQVVESQQ